MLVTLLFVASTWAAEPQEAVDYLQGLSKTREALASSLDGKKGPITEEDFKTVCAPVGQTLKRWATDHGYVARQIAKKHRNPQNAPSPAEVETYALFEKEPGMASKIVATTEDGRDGHRVFVRIPVAKQCLHCHGPRNQRPAFIKAKYPNDLAFGFKVGDLRGLYSVFVPAPAAKPQ